MKTYKVRFVNHGYSANETFESIGAALDYAKRTHFDAAIEEVGGTIVAAWGVIGGTRFYGAARNIDFNDWRKAEAR